ncbi:NADPH:quinone reductase [Gandjariella thermophila]|uniref:Oxidoreductase n=1 Tax=Gandjariella thermophila TaxID=1931992 RepID=A0A4D4J7U5_9PSEU|nr:NADPH:quinone reductase [Gandjariella thermophila]GDY31100.1 oxidoreductase [Gandjariella thermophila]
MRAAFVWEPGPASTIQYGELPDPRAGAGEVVVRTEAVAVNWVDTFVRSGVYRTPLPRPFVVGRDVVGVVQEVGPGVGEPRPGDRVWTSSLGYDGRQGPAAEFAVVAVERCYPLPDGVDPIPAVATLHGGTTALLALRRAGLRPGEHVFVHGAGGAVGSAVVQVALDAGARVTATARDDDALARLRGWGATDVLDTRSAAPAPADVDVHWDATGRIPLAEALGTLNRRGRVVVTARRADDPVPTFDLYLRDLSVVGFVLSHRTVDELAWAAGEVNRLLAAGRLATRVARVLPLAEAAAAHHLVETGAAHGKVVLVAPDGNHGGAPDDAEV